jgi:hypothetical protein
MKKYIFRALRENEEPTDNLKAKCQIYGEQVNKELINLIF